VIPTGLIINLIIDGLGWAGLEQEIFMGGAGGEVGGGGKSRKMLNFYFRLLARGDVVPYLSFWILHLLGQAT